MASFETEALGLIYKFAKQFRYYEVSHRAKGTPDGDAKAETNKQLAEEAELFLQMYLDKHNG
jgi:hypothetical protein